MVNEDREVRNNSNGSDILIAEVSPSARSDGEGVAEPFRKKQSKIEARVNSEVTHDNPRLIQAFAARKVIEARPFASTNSKNF